MNRLIYSLVLGCLITPAIGDRFDDLTQYEKDTAIMLVAHTRYMYKNDLKPSDEPTAFLKAIRVCIVTQMKEPGCYNLMGSSGFQRIMED